MSESNASSAMIKRLEEEGEVGADYLEDLLDIVDLGGDIDIDIDHGRASIAVVAAEAGDERDLADLVGRDGEVLEAVRKVQLTGEPVSLSSMNPFERKVCHDVVAAAGLVSESEGAEPHRHVVVMPAEDGADDAEADEVEDGVDAGGAAGSRVGGDAGGVDDADDADDRTAPAGADAGGSGGAERDGA